MSKPSDADSTAPGRVGVAAFSDHVAPPEWEDDSVKGHVIRFMWDYTVSVPLWEEEGKLPEEPEWLRRALGLSDSLIEDLTRWGNDMCDLDDVPPPGSRRDEVHRGMDARARALVERLRTEIGSRYEVVHKPW